MTAVPADQAARDRALRVARLAGQRREAVPAVVAPEHRDHRHAEGREEPAAGRGAVYSGAYRRRAQQAEEGQADDRADLDQRDRVLQPRALLEAHAVHGRQERDGQGARELSAVHGPRDGAERQPEELVPGREEGKEEAQVLAEARPPAPRCRRS